MNKHAYHKILFVFVLLSIIFGIYIRFRYGLFTDLWGDEALSHFIAKHTSWTDLFLQKGQYWDFAHPSFYYLYLKTILFVGESDWVLRLSSLVWFFPSLGMVYLIAKKLSKHPLVRYLAVSIFSLHPLLANLSFQVRPYPLVIFFMMTVIYFLLDLLEGESKWPKFYLGFFLFMSFVTSYASLWLVFSLVFALIFLLVKKNFHAKSLLQSLILFFFLSFFQVIILVTRMLSSISSSNEIAGSMGNFGFTFFINQLNEIFGMSGVEFSLLFFILLVFLMSNQYYELQNKLKMMVIVFIASLVFSILFTIFFSPVFLARQMVLVTISLVFLLPLLFQNTKIFLLLPVLLINYGYLSFIGNKFLIAKDIESGIQQSSQNSVFFNLNENRFSLMYYLQAIGGNRYYAGFMDMKNGGYNQLIQSQDSSAAENFVFWLDECWPPETYDCASYIKLIKNQYCSTNSCQFFYVE